MALIREHHWQAAAAPCGAVGLWLCGCAVCGTVLYTDTTAKAVLKMLRETGVLGPPSVPAPAAAVAIVGLGDQTEQPQAVAATLKNEPKSVRKCGGCSFVSPALRRRGKKLGGQQERGGERRVE